MMIIIIIIIRKVTHVNLSQLPQNCRTKPGPQLPTWPYEFFKVSDFQKNTFRGLLLKQHESHQRYIWTPNIGNKPITMIFDAWLLSKILYQWKKQMSLLRYWAYNINSLLAKVWILKDVMPTNKRIRKGSKGAWDMRSCHLLTICWWVSIFQHLAN